MANTTFGEVSKVTARDALGKFAKASFDLPLDQNVTDAAEALVQLGSLHAKLKAAAGHKSKEEMLGLRIVRSVEILQGHAALQSHTLGVYKHHSSVVSKHRLATATATAQRRMCLCV